MLVNRQSALTLVAGVDIVLRIMRMPDHDMRLLELRQQFERFVIILVFVHIGTRSLSAIPERNMTAEENDLVGFVAKNLPHKST